MLNRKTTCSPLLAPLLASLLAACGSDGESLPDDVTVPDVADTGDSVGEDAAEDADNDVQPDAEADGSGDAANDTDSDTVEDATGPVPTELNIDGLSSAASVSFDEWGVLHASCETDTDCAAVLGYFHARDRFAQMDLRRRLTTGRIGTLAGALALDIDISNRTIFTTQEGVPIEEAMLESVSAESLAILEAYSAGVNSWLGDLAAGEN
ncbi:MAG: hypothetical protein ACJA1R_001172, partial [Flavobacteriales bacterium]